MIEIISTQLYKGDIWESSSTIPSTANQLLPLNISGITAFSELGEVRKNVIDVSHLGSMVLILMVIILQFYFKLNTDFINVGVRRKCQEGLGQKNPELFLDRERRILKK